VATRRALWGMSLGCALALSIAGSVWAFSCDAGEEPTSSATGTQSVTTTSPSARTTTTQTGQDATAKELPDLVGLELQLAQDTLQAAGWWLMSSYDTTGQDRLQVLDRNWVVVEQIPPAGTKVPFDNAVKLGVVKKGEPGSEVFEAPQGVPDVVGENLQLAIDTCQAAGYYSFDYIDVTGQDRTPIMHSNWVVVGQSPDPGTDLAKDRVVTFSIEKEGE
jgi:beta-lactam-binding protein with PASTA domain